MSEIVVATELGRTWGGLAGASMVMVPTGPFLSLPVRGAVSFRGPTGARRWRSVLGRAAGRAGAAVLGGVAGLGGAAGGGGATGIAGTAGRAGPGGRAGAG